MSNVTGTSATSNTYLKELQDQLEEEIRDARQKTASDRKRLEQRHGEQSSRLEKRFQDASEKLRNEHEAAATREKDNSRAELARLKGEVYTPVRKAMASEQETRTQARETVHQAEEQYRELSQKKTDELNNRAERAHSAASERAQKEAQNLRSSHEREVNDLSGRLAYAKSEYDRDLAAQREQMGRYNQTRDQSKQQVLADLTRSHAEQVRELHSEHSERERSLETTFDQEKQQISQSREQEKEHHSRRTEQLQRELTDKFEKTEAKRTESFLGSMERQDQAATAEITDLKSQMHELKTSPTLKNLSPEAERNLRDQLATDFSEQVRMREGAFQTKQQELLNRAQTRYNELRTESERDHMQLSQKLSVAETQGRLALSRQSLESDLDKEAIIAFKSEGFQRLAQNIEKHYQKQLDAQRRTFEDRLESFKVDSRLKTDELRQDADFQLRMERRTSAGQQNELIREYEKRLSDQREDSAEVLRMAKEAADKAVLDLELRHRRDLEQMTDLHERRLAGFEQQYHERERVSAKNHQEQIEKLKRTHALLIAKKS